jgi:hypothetical protein
MSRALCLKATQNEVIAMCGKHKAGYSVVEPLHSGGTRVVLLNSHDAAVISRAFAGKILTGDVVRTPIRLR